MGALEWPRSSDGTRAVAEAVAGADAYSVIGGVDALCALELLEGEELPGFASIPSAPAH